MVNEKNRSLFDGTTAQNIPEALRRLTQDIDSSLSDLERRILGSRLPSATKEELLAKREEAYNHLIPYVYNKKPGRKESKALRELLRRLDVAGVEIIEASEHAFIACSSDEIKTVLDEMEWFGGIEV